MVGQDYVHRPVEPTQRTLEVGGVGERLCGFHVGHDSLVRLAREILVHREHIGRQLDVDVGGARNPGVHAGVEQRDVCTIPEQRAHVLTCHRSAPPASIEENHCDVHVIRR